MTFFTFLLLRPYTKWRGQKKIKTTSFHQYPWNSEVETTWISLIGWPLKTSIDYVLGWPTSPILCLLQSQYVQLIFFWNSADTRPHQKYWVSIFIRFPSLFSALIGVSDFNSKMHYVIERKSNTWENWQKEGNLININTQYFWYGLVSAEFQNKLVERIEIAYTLTTTYFN